MTNLFWAAIQPFRFLRQNVSNLIFARQDLTNEADRDFFWHELNIGWHEMREQFGVEVAK